MLQIYARKADRFCLREISNPAIEQAISPALWYDLLTPAADEVKAVEDALHLSIPTREEMEGIELSARLYQEDGAAFMTMTALSNLDSDEPAKTPVTFILRGPTLVTVRHADAKPFATFCTRALRGNGHSYESGEDVIRGLFRALPCRGFLHLGVGLRPCRLDRLQRGLHSCSRRVALGLGPADLLH